MWENPTGRCFEAKTTEKGRRVLKEGPGACLREKNNMTCTCLGRRKIVKTRVMDVT